MGRRVQDDPTRRCLKAEAWPAIDRHLWRECLRQGELFDDDGIAAHWAPATMEKYRKGYGRWLGWLDAEGELDADLAPGRRVTRERVAHYAETLKAQVAPYTVLGRVAELLAVVAVMAPEEDWGWLRQAISALGHSRLKGREKRSRLRPSRTLSETALKELRRLDAEASVPNRDSAGGYRDVLIIALLAARPLRRGNLAAIRIGTHLVPVGDGYALAFEAGEMKNRRPFEIGLPDRLAPFLRRYVEVWRPVLLKGRESDRLWISRRGRPMTGQAVYHRIRAVTKELFGAPMHPHLFRDAMATSVAIEDPEHVRIVMALNGHGSLRTDERHYIQAGSMDAGRRYHAVIRGRRRLAGGNLRKAWS